MNVTNDGIKDRQLHIEGYLQIDVEEYKNGVLIDGMEE